MSQLPSSFSQAFGAAPLRTLEFRKAQNVNGAYVAGASLTLFLGHIVAFEALTQEVTVIWTVGDGSWYVMAPYSSVLDAVVNINR